MIELTLPAGSLQAALQAFRGGADAVYLGLQVFSARKFATNFSFDDIFQLKAECIRQEKRFYVTLNTLVDDAQLDSILPILRRLTLTKPDGIIVQDLGLAYLIARDFPTLPLHGSTQMAVHTVSGVKMLQELGFSRVVLSRELTFTEISHIRRACPDIELKAFIHGAQCYGFSGLCMASHTITHRSANRGECAQICRTWFSNEERDGYFFSMTDLAAAENVRLFRDIGIDSLKIEGRMKSPEYVRFAAQYYRMILDDNSDPEALAAAKDELDTQFSRASSGGWTFSYGKESIEENRDTPSLVTDRYPGHQGIQVGTIMSTNRYRQTGSISVRLVRDLAVRDGLLLLSHTKTGITEALRFGVQTLYDRQGRTVTSAPAGSQIYIDVPKGAWVYEGDPIFCISRHNLNLSPITESSISSFRYPTDMLITIDQQSMTITAMGLPTWAGEIPPVTFEIDVQRAKREQAVQKNLERVFSSAGEGLVTMGKLTLNLTIPWTEQELFLPLSRLKEIRRSWYAKVNQHLEKQIGQEIERPLSVERKIGYPLPPRNAISPAQDRPIAWVDPSHARSQLAEGKKLDEVLAVVEEIAYIPLPPITFSEETLYDDLNALVASIDIPVRVGLNNIGHIRWAKEHPEVACYADVYLYMTNRSAVSLFIENVPNHAGLYSWIEQTGQDTTDWPAVATDAILTLPLFISRACYRYDALKLPCEGCSRHGNWTIEQNGRYYRVSVRSCLTVVSEEPEQD